MSDIVVTENESTVVTEVASGAVTTDTSSTTVVVEDSGSITINQSSAANTIEITEQQTVSVIEEVVSIIEVGGGGGAVDSVNGQTGTVVLTADDVGALAIDGSNSNQDIDIGAYALNAGSLKINGTNGAGHIHLKHQASDATSQANGTTIFADSLGDLKWKNDNLYYTTLLTSGNTADRVYTFPNASGTVALTSDLSSYATTSALTSGLATKQDILVSGTNIKTINSTSLLGSGDIAISASPAGSTGHVQFNTSGAFDAEQYFYYDKTSKRLEVFSSLGTEKVVNGTFTGGSSGWTVGTGWAYSSNTMTKNANGTGTLLQNIGLVLGEECFVTFTISAMTVSSVTITMGGVTLGTVTANGTYEYRVVPTSTASLTFTPTNTSRFTLDNISVKPLTGGSIATDSIGIGGANRRPTTTKVSMNFSHSNGAPATTRAIEFNNAGSYTWFDFNFSGINRSYLGANFSGGIDLWLSGGNYFALYNKNTSSVYNYSTPSSFSHSGAGFFGTSVGAGMYSTASSTLQSAGGTALKVRRVVSNTTLDNTATKWIANATSAACTGTPTYSCASYTNSTDCLARDAHGGCSWFTGYDCSAFSYEYGMGSCTSQSGCAASESSCSGAGDQTTCESQDDSYGGSCTWTSTSNDCSSFDESTCSSYSSSGCSMNYDYCYNYSDGGGDGTACGSVTSYGCSYDTDTGTCSDGVGDYGWFTSCSGSYTTEYCDGNYYTGNCTGSYGAACTGTSSCLGIDDSTSCGSEAGCTWSTAVNLSLPAITTCPDRDYWIYKDGSGGTVNIYPNGTDQINGTTSYVLSADKEWVHISPYRETASCGVYYPSNQSTCNSTSGCSVQTSNCSWDSMSSTCSGDASCTGIGDQSTCESTSYYSGCNGAYVAISNWFKFGS